MLINSYYLTSDVSVTIQDSWFSWRDEDEFDGFQLAKINMEIRQGSLTIITGDVGSGKSSIMAALTGNLTKISGSISINVSEDLRLKL